MARFLRLVLILAAAVGFSSSVDAAPRSACQKALSELPILRSMELQLRSTPTASAEVGRFRNTLRKRIAKHCKGKRRSVALRQLKRGQSATALSTAGEGQIAALMPPPVIYAEMIGGLQCLGNVAACIREAKARNKWWVEIFAPRRTVPPMTREEVLRNSAIVRADQVEIALVEARPAELETITWYRLKQITVLHNPWDRTICRKRISLPPGLSAGAGEMLVPVAGGSALVGDTGVFSAPNLLGVPERAYAVLTPEGCAPGVYRLTTPLTLYLISRLGIPQSDGSIQWGMYAERNTPAQPMSDPLAHLFGLASDGQDYRTNRAQTEFESMLLDYIRYVAPAGMTISPLQDPPKKNPCAGQPSPPAPCVPCLKNVVTPRSKVGPDGKRTLQVEFDRAMWKQTFSILKAMNPNLRMTETDFEDLVRGVFAEWNNALAGDKINFEIVPKSEVNAQDPPPIRVIPFVAGVTEGTEKDNRGAAFIDPNAGQGGKGSHAAGIAAHLLEHWGTPSGFSTARIHEVLSHEVAHAIGFFHTDCPDCPSISSTVLGARSVTSRDAQLAAKLLNGGSAARSTCTHLANFNSGMLNDGNTLIEDPPVLDRQERNGGCTVSIYTVNVYYRACIEATPTRCVQHGPPQYVGFYEIRQTECVES